MTLREFLSQPFTTSYLAFGLTLGLMVYIAVGTFGRRRFDLRRDGRVVLSMCQMAGSWYVLAFNSSKPLMIVSGALVVASFSWDALKPNWGRSELKFGVQVLLVLASLAILLDIVREQTGSTLASVVVSFLWFAMATYSILVVLKSVRSWIDTRRQKSVPVVSSTEKTMAPPATR